MDGAGVTNWTPPPRPAPLAPSLSLSLNEHISLSLSFPSPLECRQQAGSYDGPFVWYSFGPQSQQTVQCDGTPCNDTAKPGCYVVNDTLVKDKHGRPIPSLVIFSSNCKQRLDA